MIEKPKPEECTRAKRVVRFVINDLVVGVERKAIRNLHLSVYPPDGRVHVSAPFECSDERIRMYVLEKWVWLAEKRRAIGEYRRQNEREYVSGEAHYFRGSLYRLKVEEDDNARLGVIIHGDYIVLTVREKSSAAHRAAVMAAWYRAELMPIVEGYVRKWEKELNVDLAEFEIRAMSARWGTCLPAKAKAIFNVELAKKPLKCVEYVVAHELAHLIERRHNADFKRILDRHFPDWREIKDNLNLFPV